MSIGNVIRKYRKLKNLTQEEMARRLGVTAPAVNKWEHGNSYPDITLLAPIARLLDISLDTLLSFRRELTQEEINEIVCEVDKKFREVSYEDAFRWAKQKLEQYPDCEALIINLAVMLDAQCIIQEPAQTSDYDEYICSLYIRVLDSDNEALRLRAADSLTAFYMRKKQYDKAETYLEYLSIQNPERKRKQAQIYAETGRTREAYQAYETLLFSDYQRDALALQGMYQLALREGDRERMHRLAAKQQELSHCFEMGRFHELSWRLDPAVAEKDADAVIAIVEETFSCMEQIGAFRESWLYEHMAFSEIRGDFLVDLKEKLLKDCREDERFAFLREDERWRRIVGG